ncbi:unnamed protein product, partial [Nesidiocoris tenuis]
MSLSIDRVKSACDYEASEFLRTQPQLQKRFSFKVSRVVQWRRLASLGTGHGR